VLIPAFAGLALTTAILGQVSTPLAFIVVLGALGVASAYSGVPPAPMLSDVAPEELMGTAVGVFRFVGDLGFVLGPLIAVWSAGSFGFGTAFTVTAIPALVAVGLVVSIKKR
jgi:MFS family permease